MALKVFYEEDAGERRKKVLVMPTWTDNRGNGAALNKLMTTRYPASAVLMELASHMKAMALKVRWRGLPLRQQRCRRAGKWEHRTLRWHILPEAPLLGREAEDMYDVAKRDGALPNKGRKQKRKRAGKRLKLADPW